MAALAAGSPTVKQAREAAASVEKLHALGTDYVSKLRALEQPSGDKKAIDAFLTPTGRVVDALGDAATALKAGAVVDALAALQRATPLDAQAKRAAGAYGFKQCGSVVSPGS